MQKNRLNARNSFLPAKKAVWTMTMRARQRKNKKYGKSTVVQYTWIGKLWKGEGRIRLFHLLLLLAFLPFSVTTSSLTFYPENEERVLYPREFHFSQGLCMHSILHVFLVCSAFKFQSKKVKQASTRYCTYNSWS
jgi:hypothetical protein